MSHRGHKAGYQRQAPPALREQASAWHWRGGSTGLFDGAKFRGALRSAYPSGYDLDYVTIRARARQARWDSAHARAIIRRLVDNVIGTGMSASCAPVWDLPQRAAPSTTTANFGSANTANPHPPFRAA